MWQSRTHSSNSGSSWGAGVTLGFGQQNGISFQLGGNTSQGRANGQETAHDNTLVTACQTLTLKSGGDTTLAGAQLGGQTVQADVGGNLIIQTLQDSSDYHSQQQSSGFGVSICPPPICVGASSASVSASGQHIDHHYQSATGQSGIQAGSGGFDIHVTGDTALIGGAITSSAPQGQNSLSTRSLSYQDLDNRQDTSASSWSISVGNQASALAQAASNLAANAAGQAGLPANSHQSSQTLAVISPANITITGKDEVSQSAARTLTGRDATTANQALKNTLSLQDAANLQAQQQTAQQNQQAAQLVGSVVFNIAGDVAAKNGWGEGSPQKLALHALAGYIQAKAGGQNGGAGMAAALANEATTQGINGVLVLAVIRHMP